LTRLLLAASFVLAGFSLGPSHAAARATTMTVGAATLHKCEIEEHTVAAYCGSIQVPLNYNQPSKDGSITVGYAWLPATAETASFAVAPTLVAEEGGPGYPASGSAGDYQVMLGTAYLATHNMLVVDERGTGLSSLINCKPLQSTAAVTTTPVLLRAIRSCGQSLDHKFHRAGGGFVHASDLFTTANSTRDMARVLNTLNLDKVDLYGDSYGTYFSQSFMSHFPKRLRSVVLDSAYEARDLDPWYHTTLTTARRAFQTVCDRSPACHKVAPGSAWHRIGQLARRLRAHPFTGVAPGLDAKPVTVRMNVTALVNLVNDAGFDYDPYRQLDAAIRAYLQGHDAVPLLRLYAQDEGYDYTGSTTSPGYYSNGQYYAISCADYPQLFNTHDPSKQRRRQFAAHVRHHPAHAFAPFTVKEWVHVNPFTEPYQACTSWPKRVHRADPPVVPHTSMDASHVPVLILNGEIDSLTPAAGGAHIHHQIGPDSRHIVTANTVHLVAVDNPRRCGQHIVRQFLASPSAAMLKSLNSTCASKVRPIRTVGRYPHQVAQMQPARGTLARTARQRAAVALAAAVDAAYRYAYLYGSRDLGLHGGTVTYTKGTHGTRVAHFHHAKWTTDSALSGHVRFSSTAQSGKGHVRLTTSGGSIAGKVTWRGHESTLIVGKHVLSQPTQ
jgi:pimeloyl-ACP methyl ester carboxylesterase